MSWQFFDSNGNEQVATGTAAEVTQSYYILPPAGLHASTTFSMGQSTSYAFPMQVPYPVSCNFIRLPASWAVFASTTGATSTSTRAWTASQLWTYNMQMFGQGIGANSMSLSQIASSSWGLTNQISLGQSNVASSWSMTQKITYPASNGTSANVYSTFSTSTNANSAAYLFSTNSLSGFTGFQFLDLPWSTSLAPGNYFMGFGVSSSFATETAALSVMPRLSNVVSFLGNSNNTNVFHEMNAATNSSIMIPAGLGSFSIVGGATTASLDMTRISSQASHILPVVAFHRTA